MASHTFHAAHHSSGTTPAPEHGRTPREELWDILFLNARNAPRSFALVKCDWPATPAVVANDARYPERWHCTLSNQAAHWIVRHGISADALEPLATVLDMPKTQLAPLLGVDRTTLRRYGASRKGGESVTLPSHTAESVLRLAEIDALAKDTFESEQGAKRWLKTPHPMLDDETPLEAAATSYGGQRVREILVAIKHGGVA